MSDKELTRCPFLRRHLGDRSGLEPGAFQEAEPILPAEKARAVGLVHSANKAVSVSQQEGVLREHPRVLRVGVPHPLQIADSPTVIAVGAAKVGPLLEALSRVVGDEDGDPTGSAVDERRVDRLAEIGSSTM
jgi:hypothetical protein